MNESVESKIAPPETLPNNETNKEAANESVAVDFIAPTGEQMSEAAAPAPVAVEPALSVVADPVVVSIEKILSEDMVEHFRAMPPASQEAFKAKGEETVSKLRVIMGQATIKAKEVLKLIVAWLKFIPGVNKYFLEQESKIKTDKILELHRREHGEG